MSAPVPSVTSLSLIEYYEVGGAGTYNSRPVWPGGASGLTIGIGYDLGYANTAQIATDWLAVSPAIQIRLQSYAGRTGASAHVLLAAAQDIIIPWGLAKRVFEETDIPRASALTAQAFQNTDQLSPDSFGALVSLVFNRGASMTDTSPGNRLEMREIRDAMQAAEFNPIPDLIRSMKRLWQGRGLDGLLARRDAEAALFEKGLRQQQQGVI